MVNFFQKVSQVTERVIDRSMLEHAWGMQGHRLLTAIDSGKRLESVLKRLETLSMSKSKPKPPKYDRN